MTTASISLATLALALVACGGAQAGQEKGENGDGEGDDPAADARSIVDGSIALSEGFTRIKETCAPDAEERCNGADDNCNGEIDEVCGLDQGALHIALTWGSDADLDLNIVDPNGETLSQQHRETSSGGRLQHDGRGACQEQKMPRVESASFEGPLMAGTYSVEVTYWGECAASGVTTSSMTMVSRKKLVGVFNGEISPGERRRAFTFIVR